MESLLSDSESVILSSNNSILWVISYLSIKSIGKVPIIIDPTILKSSMNSLLHERKVTVITNSILNLSSDFIEINIKNIINSLDRQSHKKINHYFDKKSADIIYTSGTTNKPKGVFINEESYLHTTDELIRVFNQSSKDIELLSMPFSHSFGLARLRCALSKGSGGYISDGLRNIPKIYEGIIKIPVNALSLVPSALYLFKNVLRKNIDKISNNIKYIEIGSSAISNELNIWLKNNFKKSLILHHYGMTEASRSFFCPRGLDDTNQNNWVGFPAKSVKYRLVDIKKDDLTNYEIGEIQISGKNLALKYFKDKALTKKYFSNKWFSTGDLGYIEDKKLFLLGRKDGQINVGGNKVYSGEIEQIIKSLKIINDSTAFAIEDEIYGFRVGVLLELDSRKIEEGEIEKLLKDAFCNFPEYKRPKKFWILEKLPISASGKKIRDLKIIKNLINEI